MQTRAALAALLALCSLACGGSSSGGVVVDNGRLTATLLVCPDCKDAITLRSYGKFAFFGTDGALSDMLLRQCGFTVSQSAPSGTSDAVQIRGCGGGVEFAFASRDFQAYRVRDGWRGRTDTGFGIGSTIDEVLAAQPGFVQVDTFTYLIDSPDLRAEANFTSDRRLVELIVGRGFRR